MLNRLIAKTVFYLLVVGIAFAGGVLFIKAATRPSPPPQPEASLECVITIDGQRYDVTSLRATHAGGDIFRCGADMSAAFRGQHGENIDMMKKYLIE